MTILVDIDSTITNFSEALLNRLNFIASLSNGIIHDYDEIIDYDWFDKNYDNPWRSLDTTGFWDTVKVSPEAVSFLQSWVRKGYTVRLVTASHFTDTLGYKIRKTLEAFNPKLINEQNVIVAQDKSLIKGDVLIDDCVDNLKIFDGSVICYAQPWNTEVEDWNKEEGNLDCLGYNCRRYDNWESINIFINEMQKFYFDYWERI